MITSTRSLGSAPLVVIGVSAAAGLVLTLTSRIAGPAPVSAFGVGVLVTAALRTRITRGAAERHLRPAGRATPESLRPSTVGPGDTRRLARLGPSRPAPSLVNRGSERGEQSSRYRGANQIGLTEWRLAPVVLDDQDEESRAAAGSTGVGGGIAGARFRSARPRHGS